MSKITLVFLLVFVSFVSVAQQKQSLPKKNIESSALTKSQISHADLWSLSTDEYKKYLKILNSPRGYFTPNLEKNPLLALALEAETEAERQKYADQWVRLQYENNVKVISWQLEVNEAWKRQYPGIPRFTYKRPGLAQHSVSSFSLPSSKSSFSIDSLLQKQANKPRTQLYIAIKNCVSCISAFEQQYKDLKAGKVTGVDIHFTGSPSKQEIIQWAIDQKLNSLEVNEQRIVTLNIADKQVKTVPLVEFK